MHLFRAAFESDFYPRPPRGGRRGSLTAFLSLLIFLSTPSARRATVGGAGRKPPKDISIHALREEGDTASAAFGHVAAQFLSTPSARRATRKAHVPLGTQ